MNNKGFAITGIMYTMLLLFVVILAGALVMMGSRKHVLDDIRSDVLEKIEEKILPSNADIDYVYDPTNQVPNSTPCVVDGYNVTHVIDNRNSKTYAIGQIGTQCWMLDNLAYTTPACLAAAWDATAPHDACRLNGGAGWEMNEVLYQWSAAMAGSTTEGAKGMCPLDWHVASDSEWKTLEMTVGMTQVQADATGWRGTNQGQILKSTNPSWSGTNTSGFNAKPVGYRDNTNVLVSDGSMGEWFTSTSAGSLAYIRAMSTSFMTVYRIDGSQSYGNSVRCVMD